MPFVRTNEREKLKTDATFVLRGDKQTAFFPKTKNNSSWGEWVTTAKKTEKEEGAERSRILFIPTFYHTIWFSDLAINGRKVHFFFRPLICCLEVGPRKIRLLHSIPRQKLYTRDLFQCWTLFRFFLTYWDKSWYVRMIPSTWPVCPDEDCPLFL